MSETKKVPPPVPPRRAIKGGAHDRKSFKTNQVEEEEEEEEEKAPEEQSASNATNGKVAGAAGADGGEGEEERPSASSSSTEEGQDDDDDELEEDAAEKERLLSQCERQHENGDCKASLDQEDEEVKRGQQEERESPKLGLDNETAQSSPHDDIKKNEVLLVTEQEEETTPMLKADPGEKHPDVIDEPDTAEEAVKVDEGQHCCSSSSSTVALLKSSSDVVDDASVEQLEKAPENVEVADKATQTTLNGNLVLNGSCNYLFWMDKVNFPLITLCQLMTRVHVGVKCRWEGEGVCGHVVVRPIVMHLVQSAQ